MHVRSARRPLHLRQTSGDLSSRAKAFADRAWLVLLAVAVLFLVSTYFATSLFTNFTLAPVLLIVPFAAVASLFLIRVFSAKGSAARTFAASCTMIVFISLTGIIGLFPNLIPSNLDIGYSMTIYNSSSSKLTLAIMTAVALVFVPIVIAYKVWVYRVFSAKVSSENMMEEVY